VLDQEVAEARARAWPAKSEDKWREAREAVGVLVAREA
jgi:hypothetical protein